MKITMFANYADPQIVPFCRTVSRLTGDQFTLAVTEAFPLDLLAYGYPDTNREPYVRQLFAASNMHAEAAELIRESDALIYAHCPKEYFDLCVSSSKPVFRFSQHLYRDGNLSRISRKVKLSNYVRHTLFTNGKPVYLMCIGTYTAQDYSLTDSYTGRMFEFGEFPERTEVDPGALIESRSSEMPVILWANEFTDVTHPEVFLDLAERLKGEKVRLIMAGGGVRFEETKHSALLREVNIEFVKPKNRQEMNELLKKASVFVMSSDYREGWGNLLNQAMNHACVPVVSTGVGSNKLIDHDVCGLLYENGNTEDLYAKVKGLLSDAEHARMLSMHAYEAIRDEWNGEIAGERFVALAEALGNGLPSPFESGLCAPARIVTQKERIESACPVIKKTDSLPKMDMSQKRIMIVEPFGGLGNRLRGLDYALYLKKELHLSDQEFFWLDDRNCGCRMEDILDTSLPHKNFPFPKHSIQENLDQKNVLGAAVSAADNLIYRALRKKYDPITIDDSDYYCRSEEMLAALNEKLDQGTVYFRVCNNPLKTRDYSWLAFSKEVHALADQVRRKYPDYISVHIRRTDHKLCIFESPTYVFFDFMQGILEKKPDQMIYLASDDEEVLQMAQAQFGANLVPHIEGELDRTTKKGIQTAAAEFLILAGSKKIYGSSSSSFSIEPSLYGKVPLEMLTVYNYQDAISQF